MSRVFLIGLVALLLSGCLTKNPGGYYRGDGPHANSGRIDYANIPDAVPKVEPIQPSRSRPYTVLGRKYYPLKTARGYRAQGMASWYGRKFHGRRTATGEPYDMYAMTAAHKTLPLPSYVRVTNISNGRSVVVRVNDRGPFLHNRVIDLSYVAAAKLGMIGKGTARVEVVALMAGEGDPDAVEVQGTGNADIVDEQLALPGDTTVPAASAALFVQVGAFGNRRNAELLKARLEKAGLGPVTLSSAGPNSSSLFRVRLGPYATAAQLDTVIIKLRKMGLTGAHPVLR